MDEPTLILILGQSGSGKNELNKMFYEKGIKQYTNTDKIESSKNYLLDGIDNKQSLIDTVNKFKNAGYKTEAVVLSVPEKISWLSVMETMQNNQTKSAHSKECDFIPETIRKLYDDKDIHSVKILDSNFNSLFSDQLINGNWQRNKNPAEIILDNRSKPLSLVEINQHTKRWEQVLNSIEKNNLSSESLFNAKVDKTHFDNELKYLNVSSKLTHSQTYREAFYKNIDENIINKPMSEGVKLKLISSVYKLADDRLREQARVTGDKYKDMEPSLSEHKITLQKSNTIEKFIEKD